MNTTTTTTNNNNIKESAKELTTDNNYPIMSLKHKATTSLKVNKYQIQSFLIQNIEHNQLNLL